MGGAPPSREVRQEEPHADASASHRRGRRLPPRDPHSHPPSLLRGMEARYMRQEMPSQATVLFPARGVFPYLLSFFAILRYVTGRYRLNVISIVSLEASRADYAVTAFDAHAGTMPPRRAAFAQARFATSLKSCATRYRRYGLCHAAADSR